MSISSVPPARTTKINRLLVAKAIRLAAESEKGRGIIILDPEHPEGSTSVDAAMLVIRKVELCRCRNAERHIVETLPQTVSYALRTAGFDSGRRRAYTLVVLRYYSLIASMAAQTRRTTGIPRKRTKRRPPVPMPLQLEG